MQPLDPITLVAIAVVVAIVLSALLLLLFATREEKFEDVLAAQRSEQEAYLARTAAAKTSKPRKKFAKGKKKYSDDGEVVEEISEPMVEETSEASAHIEGNSGFLPSGEFSKDSEVPSEEKLPIAGEKSAKERHGKKKSKKSAPKEESSVVSEGLESLEKPREDVEAVTAVDFVPTLESEPVKREDFEIEEQKPPDSSETVPSAKKTKSKSKVVKDKGPIQGECYSYHCRSSYFISNLQEKNSSHLSLDVY